jgi:hypothetical protein
MREFDAEECRAGDRQAPPARDAGLRLVTPERASAWTTALPVTARLLEQMPYRKHPAEAATEPSSA